VGNQRDYKNERKENVEHEIWIINTSPQKETVTVYYLVLVVSSYLLLMSYFSLKHFTLEVWGQENVVVERKINTFVEQGCITSIKNVSKDMYNIYKIFR